VKTKAKINIERIHELEKEIGHDLIAFLWALEEEVGEEGRWLHFGLTSSDVKDTALALLLRDALTLIQEKVERLKAVLRRWPWRGKRSQFLAAPMANGRSPRPLVTKFWSGTTSFCGLRSGCVGQKTGSVWASFPELWGTHAYFPPEAEELALKALGLRPCAAATQVISRDRHAEVVFALASAASLVEKIALEVRHLSRAEVKEVEEGRPEGSSAMPHKRNPILSERLCGLARVVRAAVEPILESGALWHERDMSPFLSGTNPSSPVFPHRGLHARSGGETFARAANLSGNHA
jgi:adenylosuccinate lyase